MLQVEAWHIQYACAWCVQCWIFAQEKGIDTAMFERKMDNVKPCGGDIPLSMVGEFNMPESVVDRKVKYILQLFCKLQIPCKWFEGHCKD